MPQRPSRFPCASARIDAADRSEGRQGPGKLLFPAGCRTVGEATDHFLQDIGPEELSALDTPPGAAGARFCALARRILPDAGLTTTAGGEDLLFYREVPHLNLSDLEQLGPVAQEAYRQINSVEHFTPHTRTDIQDWRPAGG